MTFTQQMDAEDIVRRDIERLNIANFSSPLGAEVASDRFTGERSWESNGKAPMKSRAKSEYSYLDKVNRAKRYHTVFHNSYLSLYFGFLNHQSPMIATYNYLDKLMEMPLFQLHCVPNNRWSVEQQPSPDECHDSGVSIPLAISQGFL